MLDPVRLFVAALPSRCRHEFNPDYRTIPAIHTLAARGVDLEAYAARITRDLIRTPRAAIHRRITFRLLRDTGQLDDQEKN